MTPSRRLLSLPAYAWDKSRWWHESNDWREGRLGAGGKGLIDVRLPRATPTWVARLDSRHMAYLKDHKVENLVVFPAAAFVDIVLEAGVQFFERRPFVVEDFEIRKPLIVPESTAGMILEMIYEPNDRTFTIQSRFENAASWSVHVVGSMRSERTDSAFATSRYEDTTAPGLSPVEVEGFYGYMSDMGLRYGEEFRAVRELAASGGKSSGLVSLSQNAAKRAAEYPLHPVLFDGALQTFSAGAKTVEDRTARLKLPVRFAKILYLRTPGASIRVNSAVQHCNEEYLEGSIGIYDDDGQPCVQVDGFRAVSMAAVRRSGSSSGGRDLLYHVDWERKPASLSAVALSPVPLSQLREAAHQTLEDVIAMRGKAALEAIMVAQDNLAAALVARGLRDMGVKPTAKKPFTAESLRVAEGMRRAFARLMAALVKRGLLKEEGDGLKATPAFASAANSANKELRTFISQHPGNLPEALLCSAACGDFAPIMRGEKDAVQVLFASANSELLDQFYGDGLFSSHWMAAIATAVQEAARQLPEGRGLRILEVGAGTAGLSSQVLPALDRGRHSYTFTDVSAGFFPAALGKLSAFPEVECKVFDLEKPATEQGFEAGAAMTSLIGTNVFHAVADVRESLTNVCELLKPGGTLMFMDTATPQLWTESVFGLTSGWWHLTDRELRPEQPLLPRAEWEKVLLKSGFSETASLPGLKGPQGEGQMGLLARKAWVETSAPASPTLEKPVEESWLVFADESGLGKRLASSLVSTGVRCRVVRRGKKFASAAARMPSPCARKRRRTGSSSWSNAPRMLRQSASFTFGVWTRKRAAAPRMPSWAPMPCFISPRRLKT